MDPVVVRTILVVVGIVVVILAGLWWKRRDGRVRTVAPSSTTAASTTSASSDASLSRSTSGRDTPETGEGDGTEPTAAGSALGADTGASADTPRLTQADLDAVGLELSGAEAAAVLFGSPTCAPCANVKQTLGELADEHAGFRWVYADAGDHLDLTQQHRIMRVPTVLMLNQTGDVVARASGVPKIDDLRQALNA